MLPFKFKVRTWQADPSYHTYPKWAASQMPEPVLVFQQGDTQSVPCLTEKQRGAIWFETQDEALAYYESPAYHQQYIDDCLIRAGHLFAVINWLKSQK